MISYAQNQEDVVLARVFNETRGFYIDVGAASPTIHSITRHFYEMGWRGINVEPVELWHNQLVASRPRDANLLAGLGEQEGLIDFYDVSSEASEESTFSPEVADGLRSRGLSPHVRRVSVTTLAAICRQHLEGQFDFLKVDVEGFELEVLRGGDWGTYRPLVAVIESTRPSTSQRADDGVMAFMTSVGYVAALFDGINVFYVRDGEPDIVALLSSPANATDRYEDFALHESRVAVERLEGILSERAEQADAAEARIEALSRELAELRTEGRNLDKRLQTAQRDIAAARHEARDSEMQFRVTREALEALLAQDR